MHIKSKVFRFKQFSVEQPKGVFKIGTDAVLLGAWTPAKHPKQILDVGCGTGIIGLMLAQRFLEANVTAIDKYPLHAVTTLNNFKASAYKNRFNVVNSNLQQFKLQNKLHTTYDCIVCNPPYFAHALKAKSHVKHISKHQDDLTIDILFEAVRFLLHPSGTFSLILPFTQCDETLRIAKSNNLYLYRICKVFSTVKSIEPKRVLMAFTKNQSVNKIEEILYIQESKHREYTHDYKQLTKDFYLLF